MKYVELFEVKITLKCPGFSEKLPILVGISVDEKGNVEVEAIPWEPRILTESLLIFPHPNCRCRGPKEL